MSVKLAIIPDIPKYYKGKDILITGATGFMGMVLIEKLLAACPDLNRIFAIVRSKKGLTPEDRKCEFSKSELFKDLLRKNPNAFDKLTFIPGDIGLPGLGMSDDDKKQLKNVSIVFHSAAVVRFDEPLKSAILNHVRGTREILDLSKTFKNLKAFVHVSTTFCNMDNTTLEDIKKRTYEERFYPNVTNWRELIKIAENCDEHTLDILTKHYTRYALNTYIYTKAVAENVCKEYEKTMPLVIFRPAIVAGKSMKPAIGFVSNLNGPMGLSIGCYLGILRTFQCDSDVGMDYIPVDAAINAIIISACKRDLVDVETPVINAVIKKCSIAFNLKFLDIVQDELPLEQAIWPPSHYMTACQYDFYIQSILFHMIPAFFIDSILKLCGKKPKLLNIQRKIQLAQKTLRYFLTKDFYFYNTNYFQLDNYLTPEDKSLFITKNIESVKNVEQFYLIGAKFIKNHILMESDDGIPGARKKQKLLRTMQKAVNYTLGGIVLWISYNWWF